MLTPDELRNLLLRARAKVLELEALRSELRQAGVEGVTLELLGDELELRLFMDELEELQDELDELEED